MFPSQLLHAVFEHASLTLLGLKGGHAPFVVSIGLDRLLALQAHDVAIEVIVVRQSRVRPLRHELRANRRLEADHLFLLSRVGNVS